MEIQLDPVVVEIFRTDKHLVIIYKANVLPSMLNPEHKYWVGIFHQKFKIHHFCLIHFYGYCHLYLLTFISYMNTSLRQKFFQYNLETD